MYLFVVFLFPVVLISFLVLNFEKKNILVACSSFIFSATFCLIVGLLENFYRLIPVNYFDNFIFHFTSEIILPVISLLVLFYFLSKDDLSYKVKSIFPLLVAFYSVYMPFITIFENSELCWFTLFLKPVLFICMFVGFSSAVNLIYKLYINKSNKIYFLIYGVVILLTLTVPSLIEALWLDGFSIFALILISLCYILSTCFLCFYSKKID